MRNDNVYIAPVTRVIVLDAQDSILQDSYGDRPSFRNGNGNLEDFEKGEDIF